MRLCKQFLKIQNYVNLIYIVKKRSYVNKFGYIKSRFS